MEHKGSLSLEQVSASKPRCELH